MKKLNFSKKTFCNNIDKIKKFLVARYVSFFKDFPLLLCFIITALLNTLLLRIITIGNYMYIKPFIADLGMIFIMSSFAFIFKTEKRRRRYLVILSFVTSVICIKNQGHFSKEKFNPKEPKGVIFFIALAFENYERCFFMKFWFPSFRYFY